MFKTPFQLFLILFFGCALQTSAQSIKIDAIEITIVGETAEDDFGDYSRFVAKTRNPALFQSVLENEIDQNGTINRTGFSIDFIFSQISKPQNEFILGFQAGSVTNDLYTGLTFESDSASISGDITNQSQFFDLKAGYRRIFRMDKKIKVLVGANLQLGIPVSSNTTQTFNNPFFGDEYKFFAKQHVNVGLALNYGIRFKLFRNVYGAFVSRPTLFFQQVDGTPSSSILRGTNLSFQFKIRS